MRFPARLRPALLLALAVASATPAASATAVAEGGIPIDSHTFGGLQARSLGPAIMSGRITAIDAVPRDPLVIYVGAASGGVWKSTDAGVTFSPVFDEHPQSVGALAIDPQRPDTVWVGTGEANTRNSVSVGDGVYRSDDGGATWHHLGLPASERIARILVHPSDGDTVYVCAVGPLWSAGGERGVFRTRDGGATWEAVLTVDENTGCSELALDPQQPDVLYAGMWQVRRKPYFFTSGGPGSGLYKTTDGGANWRRLEQGLPQGELGRIAVAVAPSRPSRVYALVEAEKTALFRSDDLGESWMEVNSSFNVQVRPFYFAYLVVDPVDFDRVYRPGLVLTISTDGGRSFTSPFSGGFGGGVHPDLHALWIDPRNPHHLLLGTDGGVYVSYDRGSRFRFVRDLPVSQFYQVSVDMEWPYNVYGGLQDNGTWTGPSRGIGGVRNADWRNLGFGDGFHAYPDPFDSDLVYLEYQGGNLMRVRKGTGETKDIKPYPAAGEPPYRFNWNTPIHLSRAEPGTLYYGAQFLFRSRDRGDTWERISPDLTTDDPAKQRQRESGGLSIDNSTAENHTTLYTISESPVDRDILWVGTDDGNLQLTTDGGATWRNVVASVPGVPLHTWVSSVEASHHDRASAFVTFDGHHSGDMTPYAFRTTDLGATWEPLATDEIQGFAHVVRQDPVNPELLFLGTELGLFVTLDGGRHWARFTGGVPRVPVHDLFIHPREHDLVIGTHGRGIFILDDLTPLRHLTSQALASEVVLLPSRAAVMPIPAAAQRFDGHGELVAPNPPESAQIVYYLQKRHIFGDLKVEVYDAEGQLLTTLPGGKRRGINRVDWPMRLKAPKVPPASSLVPAFTGPRLPEGTYRVRLIKGSEELEGAVTLVADPRSTHTAQDRLAQQETALELYRMLEELTWIVETTSSVRDQARGHAQELGRTRLAGRLDRHADRLEALRTSLVATSEAGWLSGDEQLRERLGALFGVVNGYDGRPSGSQLGRLGVLQGELAAARRAFEELTAAELAALNRELSRGGREPLTAWSQEEWQRRREQEPVMSSPADGALEARWAGRFQRRVPLPLLTPMM